MADRDVMYRGRYYRLQVKNDIRRRRPRVDLEGDIVTVYMPEKYLISVDDVLENWYIQQAKMMFPIRVMHYQRLTGGVVRKIRIKDQKTRWGSCSSLNNLNFSWRLIMAPPEVLDYVVVHELCHLTHMNHSKDFWGMVARIMPGYQESKRWLKENGMLLQNR